MVYTTEFFMFEASDAFRTNPNVIIPALSMILKSDGIRGTPGYYGKGIENSSMGFTFFHRNNYEAHKALQTMPSHPEFIRALSRCLGGACWKRTYHVKFSAPVIALNKPVTEILILTLKTPGSRTPVINILSALSEASGRMLVYGQPCEDKNKYIVLSGWETIEEHEEIAAAPEVVAAFERLYALVDEDHFYHTKLSRYQA